MARPIKTRSITLALVPLVLGAAVALAAARDEDALEPAATAEPAADPSLARRASFAALEVEAGPCAMPPGTRMAYEVVSETAVEIDFGRLTDEVEVDGAAARVAATPAQAHHIERSWDLELAALARDDDGSTVLAARIDDRGLRLVDGRQAGPAPQPSAELSTTFLIRVDARCGLREFAWRSAGELDAAREQQMLVAGLGFWAPPTTAEPQGYGGTGFDATGRYAASFFYEDGRITGEAQSFALGSERGRGAPVTVEILASRIEAELAPGAWFETLVNERDLELQFAGRPFGSHFRATRAHRVEPGRFDPIVDLDDGGWRWGRLTDEARDPSREFDPALREQSFADVIDRYRELVATATPGEYGGLLRDWLRANPSGASELLAALRAGEFDDDAIAESGLFYALGAANTPEAKAALVELLERSESVGHRIAAAHAVALVEQPSAAMIELLAAHAGDAQLHPVERGSIALALGAVAHSSAERAPDVAAAAREQIRGWLHEPGDGEHERLGHALLAAGNAGHDELAGDIGRYLDHEDPTIRRHATHAMRQLSPAQAYPKLGPKLGDADRVVRTSALETAATVARRHRQPPPEAMVERASDSLRASDSAERRAAIELLATAAKHGDDRAAGHLRELFDEHLREGSGDPEQLAALGRSLPGRWRASD